VVEYTPCGIRFGSSMIPRRLHYIWVGGTMPYERKAYLDTWRETNPDFEIISWDERNIDFSISSIRRAYDKGQWATVADIVRLVIIAKYGGIYLDTDFKVFKSLTPVLNHPCFYGFQLVNSSSDWVANGAFGAVPGHWFVNQALARTVAIGDRTFGSIRPTSFGPKLITTLLREHGLKHYSPYGVYVRDVFLLPTPVFYPFGWHEKFTEACVTDQTLAAHFWAESQGHDPTWVNSLPAMLRIIRKMRRATRRIRT
jgi:hypothetical protein